MNLYKYIPKNQFRYYYSALSAHEKEIYDLMLISLMNRENAFVLPETNINSAFKIYNLIKYDVPETFFVKTIFATYSAVFNNTNIQPEYRFNQNDTINLFDATIAATSKFIDRINYLSDFEKERAIHDYIVKSVVYKDVEAPYSHEAPGTLLYRIGVCEGISKAVKWLCDRVNLKSIVAIGTSDSNGNSGGHAWNVVFLNDTPFHIDVTFDATLSNNSIRYDYFNLSELEILEDHKISNEYSLPACKHSRNWFKENNLFFHTKKELIFYLKNLEPTVKNFCFQIPIFINQKDNTTAIEETSKLIYSNLFDKQLSPSHSYTLKYNINRMVFEIDIH